MVETSIKQKSGGEDEKQEEKDPKIIQVLNIPS